VWPDKGSVGLCAGGLEGLQLICKSLGSARQSSPTLRITVETRISDGAFVVDREHFTDPGAERRDHATWIYQVNGGLIRRAWVLR
jgi:hypothetical protein